MSIFLLNLLFVSIFFTSIVETDFFLDKNGFTNIYCYNRILVFLYLYESTYDICIFVEHSFMAKHIHKKNKKSPKI